KPFGEHVEGLSHFRAKNYAVERAVKKHDFEQTTLLGGKPLLPFRLQKFKNSRRQLCRFVVGAVHGIELQLDRGQPAPQFRVFVCEAFLVDVLRQAAPMSRSERSNRRSHHRGCSATRANERCRGPASLSGSSGECSPARVRGVATRAGVLRKWLVFVVAAPPDARLVTPLGGAVEPLVHAPEAVQP